jgi:hypothetical protein
MMFISIDPLIFLIRLLLGCLIMITWFLLPITFRIGMLALLAVLVYHWRLHHAMLIRFMQEEFQHVTEE